MSRFYHSITYPDSQALGKTVGTLIMEHLQENLAAVEKGVLPAEVYMEAKKRLTKAGSVPA